MRAIIEVRMDNEAFNPAGPELARILRRLADEVEGYDTEAAAYGATKLRDINGNTVGLFEVKED